MNILGSLPKIAPPTSSKIFNPVLTTRPNPVGASEPNTDDMLVLSIPQRSPIFLITNGCSKPI